MFRVWVPGKLFLLGEYAVLEPGSLALVAAIDAELSATIETAQHFQVFSPLWQHSLDFVLSDQGLPLWNQLPAGSDFVCKALETGFAYLRSIDISVQTFRLDLGSLDPAFKRGLGSSAAVTIAVLSALLLFHKQAMNDAVAKRLLFKLALISHYAVQGGGSGADIAASIFGGITAYTSFDSVWLKQQLRSLPALIRADWPYLDIETLVWPQDWHLAVGWTGQPAKTVDFLEDFTYFKTHSEAAFHQFLFTSNTVSTAAKEALLQADWHQFKSVISQARRILSELDNHFIAELETPDLTDLISAAESLAGAAKFSGSGGGDCGIALVPRSNLKSLHEAWKASGITPLDLAISQGLRWEEEP